MFTLLVELFLQSVRFIATVVNFVAAVVVLVQHR